MTERFSKQRLVEYLLEEVWRIEKLHNLDRWNGTSQLDGKDIKRAVAYGEMFTLFGLACDIQNNNINYNKEGK